MRLPLKKLALIPIWFVGTLSALSFTILLYQKQAATTSFVQTESLTSPLVTIHDAPPLLYAAVPLTKNEIKTGIKTADARPEIIRQYLAKYQSPLEPYADLIVQVADENGFDFRWMVAIAQQESNLCKRIPPDSYNCWGWGIYGDKVTRFASYDDAIRRIAPQFKDKFLSMGSDTQAHEVMKTYTPPSDGSWAFGVNFFMAEME